MKKILFNLGDLSQLPGIFVPVYQVRNMDIYQSRNPLIISKPIDTTPPIKILTDNIENISMLEKFDKNFTKMQELIEDVDFSKFSEVEEYLNFNLDNFNDIEQRIRFKKEFYENLEAIKSKRITSTDALNLYFQHSNLPLVNTQTPEIQENNYENDLIKEEMNRSKPKSQKNSNNLSEKSNTAKKLTKNEEKKIIDAILNDSEWEEKFLKLQNETKESRKQFEKFLGKYQRFYNATKGLNITSAVLAGTAWALVATYTGLAFWTFGATAPLAAAASIQASIMTYFVWESFKSQKEMDEDWEKINQFKNSSEYERIIKFSGMSFYEFKDQLREEITERGMDLGFYYNIANLSTATNPIRILIKQQIEKIMEKTIIKIIGRKISDKITKETIAKLLIKKTVFLKWIKNAYKIIKQLTIKTTAKRGLLMSVGYVNPISAALNILDTLNSIVSVVTTMVISVELQESE
ncbi:hypothetical protein [Mesomycoplasma hyopneumoniae]|uniref:hypothetical protein n=1 Tax=Mesomycoplasma hyopneumoniae TaxID=2099 RepID=UPI000358F576|nr:hypothetical protein [Mesomycoplasma hyopneumoniae]AGQ50865.1 hypothetical protein MHL_3294 [Mesomycoplasma hyopneumoniae 7422]